MTFTIASTSTHLLLCTLFIMYYIHKGINVEIPISGTCEDTDHDTNTTVTSMEVDKEKVVSNGKDCSTMEITTDCLTSETNEMNVEITVLDEEETSKKSNKNIEIGQYPYTAPKDNIESPKVPEKSIETKFICLPVSNDETELNPGEHSALYGLECVQILDQMAFDDDDNEY